MPLALKREHQPTQNFSYFCVSLLPPGSVSAFSMRIRIRNRPPKIIADLDSKHCFHLVTDILQKSNLYPVVINLVSDGPPDTFKTFVSWLAKKVDFSQVLDFSYHWASLWISFPAQLRAVG
jgi:hypothetical protein